MKVLQNEERDHLERACKPRSTVKTEFEVRTVGVGGDLEGTSGK